MINLLSQSGHQSYGIKEYILDEPADLDNLPITDKMGSTAFIISTSQIYMINGKGEWKETSAKVSGGGIVHIDLADYGLYFGSENVSIPQEFVDILKNALDNRKAPYVHGAIENGMEGTILLDTMYTLGDMIFATGIGVLVNDGAFPAWFAILVNQENLIGSVAFGSLEGERGEPGSDGFSPTIDVSRGADATIITITDANGTNTVEIPDVSAVSSVNGKVGAVTLNAEDVGAATVESVEQLAGDIASLATKWRDMPKIKTVTSPEEVNIIEIDDLNISGNMFVMIDVPAFGNEVVYGDISVWINNDKYINYSNYVLYRRLHRLIYLMALKNPDGSHSLAGYCGQYKEPHNVTCTVGHNGGSSEPPFYFGLETINSLKFVANKETCPFNANTSVTIWGETT